MTATQTMEVVCGIFKNMKVVMGGTETFCLTVPSLCPLFVFLDGKVSMDLIQDSLGMISSDLKLSITNCRCQLKCKRYRMIGTR